MLGALGSIFNIANKKKQKTWHWRQASVGTLKLRAFHSEKVKDSGTGFVARATEGRS